MLHAVRPVDELLIAMSDRARIRSLACVRANVISVAGGVLERSLTVHALVVVLVAVNLKVKFKVIFHSNVDFLTLMCAMCDFLFFDCFPQTSQLTISVLSSCTFLK